MAGLQRYLFWCIALLLSFLPGCAAISLLLQVTLAGSGFLITSDGYILTNYHVVHGAQTITVFAGNHNYKAKLVQADLPADLALLKIPEFNLPHGILGNAEQLKLLDDVIAMGYPEPGFGRDLTVSQGKLNSIRTEVEGRVGRKTLQHDATIFHGSSGGPLFDLKGQIIGINYAIITTSGFSLAIPINEAIPLLTIIPDFKLETLGSETSLKTPSEVISLFSRIVVYIETARPRSRLLQ